MTAAAGVLIGLAACSHAPSGLSKSAYIAREDTICGHMWDRLESVNAPKSQVVAGVTWTTYLRTIASVEGKAVADQEAVPRPAKDTAELASLFTDLTHLVADTRRSAALAQAHSPAASAAMTTVQSDVGAADLASRAYGFKVCGTSR